MAKNIESEYFNMIDQVVIATDASLTVLYSNYHEKFYDKIMKKVEDLVDLELIRLKTRAKLDRCFVFSLDTLETDPKTMRMLLKMYEVIEFDSKNQTMRSYYEGLGIIDLLLAMEAYDKQYKSAIERKSLKQLNIESRRSQYSSMQLIVNDTKVELQVHDP